MVLLVVDEQDMIVTSDLYSYNLFVKNVSKFISIARSNNIAVIYNRHHDGIGSELT